MERTLDEVIKYVRENPDYVTDLIQGMLMDVCSCDCGNCIYSDICVHDIESEV